MANRWIALNNIARFREKLRVETDAEKRRVLEQLLKTEQERLAQVEEC